MADRIVIDLVEDEFNCQEAESYQDKIAKLEGKVAKMEQEIYGIKEMIADLTDFSNEDSSDYDLRDSSDEDLEVYSPIRAIAYSNFDVPKLRKSQTSIPLSEPISFIFKKLRSLRILQPRPNEIPSHPFNPAKQYAFHPGMLGHTTDERQCLKEEIQSCLALNTVLAANLYKRRSYNGKRIESIQQQHGICASTK
ncbi:hypothetical protein H5410_063881 [Solanum commersonii]|uniref:Uncharacterized protein n=1 Tax=Solanum commersonii TaxID=4109 RepID=A0A9J5WEF1_SOLCO|nr:hypothetical protein H5410_063881 [Solanum commersonii]